MLSAIAIILFTTALPFLLGRRVAHAAAARWQGRALVGRGLVLLTLLLTSFVVPLPPVWLSIHDQALAIGFLLLGIGLARQFRPSPTRRFALAVVGVALTVGLVALEVLARVIGPRPAVEVGALDEMHGLFHLADRDPRCGLIYPETAELGFSQRQWPPGHPRGECVLHVGDSLVNALEVAPEQRFAAVLMRLRPDEQHLALAAGGMGPTGYLVMLRKWLDVLHPDRVVVHVFLGNDIVTSPAYGCCRDLPLLLFAAHRPPTMRCARPEWRDGVALRWALGPAPFVLRALATHSVAALRLVDGLERAMPHWADVQLPQPDGWRTYEDMVNRFGDTMLAIRDEMAARKMPLQIALIPPRWAFSPTGVLPADAAVHRDAIAMLQKHRIAYVDAWDVVADAIRNHPETPWFFSDNVQNPHFDVAGHEMYARWLDGVLHSGR